MDLRRPDRDRLRVSQMIDVVVGRAQQAQHPIIVGSSLGGLVGAHAAARVAAVRRCVLMAPAFRFAERWQQSLGREALARWRGGEPLETEDHAGGPPLQIDYGFYEDAVAVDRSPPRPRCPTLVFHGRHDDVVPIEGSRRFVADTRGAQLVELDDDHGLGSSLDVLLPTTLSFLEPVHPDGS